MQIMKYRWDKSVIQVEMNNMPHVKIPMIYGIKEIDPTSILYLYTNNQFQHLNYYLHLFLELATPITQQIPHASPIHTYNM